MGSKMHRFWVISSWKAKNVSGTPCICFDVYLLSITSFMQCIRLTMLAAKNPTSIEGFRIRALHFCILRIWHIQCPHYINMKCHIFVYFQVFPYTVPYLYPVTNIFMTCSGYMTAAVAVNRYLDITGAAQKCKFKNGYIQASIVLFVSGCVNIPRWLEFKYKEELGNWHYNYKCIAY